MQVLDALKGDCGIAASHYQVTPKVIGYNQPPYITMLIKFEHDGVPIGFGDSKSHVRVFVAVRFDAVFHAAIEIGEDLIDDHLHVICGQSSHLPQGCYWILNRVRIMNIN